MPFFTQALTRQPVGFRGRLGGADAALVERGLESLEEAEMLVRVDGGLLVEKALDFSLQRARSRSRPAASRTFAMRARLAGLGGAIGRR